MAFELPENLATLALFLDVDGTLVPIAADPTSVRADPALPSLLAGAAKRLGGALGIISGREIESIDRLTDGAVPYLAGSHGAEYRLGPGQPVLRPGPQPDLAGLVAEIVRLTEAWPEVLIEPKRAGIAVHYRRCPHLAPELRKLLEMLLADQAQADLSLLRGDHVLEIRSPAHNKGAAVRRLMETPPFRGRRPLFIGDDVTDEDGFAVAIELGGSAIIVGDRRPTLATRQLASPAEVLALLARLAS